MNLCRKTYLKDKKSLAFFKEEATAEFWEKHWNIENLEKTIRSCKKDRLFIPNLKKLLPQGSIVLEGGCGKGHLVHALKYNGYKAIGIDFATKTVEAIKKAVPELDVVTGDVRHLPLNNEVIDGYISVGVIEHFWEGYEEIISEMYRILKKGGYLFISFPYMSPLRKIRALFNLYPVSSGKEKGNFYQFALEHKEVIKDLKNKGFILIKKIKFDGIKGFKDEIPLFKSLLQKIYNGKTYPLRAMSYFLNLIFTPFASHCILLILKKEK